MRWVGLILLCLPGLLLASVEQELPTLPEGLVVHLDAFDSSNLGLDPLGRVSRWSDKVSRRPFTNTDVRQQPLYKGNTINGGGVVSFDGQDFPEGDLLQDYFIDDPSAGDPMIRGSEGGVHVFSVARRPNAGSKPYQRLISSHDERSPDNAFQDDWISPNWILEGPKDSNGVTELSFDAPAVLEAAFEGRTIGSLRLATKWNKMWSAAVEFGEILIFDRILSAEEVRIVRSQYLDAKWGLTFEVREDPPYDIPTAGWAAYTGRHIAGDFGNNIPAFTRVTQTDDKQWDNLHTDFTLEGWFKMDPTEFNPSTGACCNFPDGTEFLQSGIDTYRFSPLVTRHPSNYEQNALAHFHVQLTRTENGVSLNAWAGCGCDDRNDPATCGLGYVVASDHRSLPDSRKVFIRPDEWYHFAVTFDGDDLSTGLQRKEASLYINSAFVHNNTWADPINQSPFAPSDICVGKGMHRTDPQPDFNDIRFGFLRNQDGQSECVTASNCPVVRDLGFTGKLDEIRIWNRVRTSRDILDTHDISIANIPHLLSAAKAEGLVAYYDWNDKNDDLLITNRATDNGMPMGVGRTETSTDLTEFYFGTPFESGNSKHLDISHRALATSMNTQNPNAVDAVVSDVQLPLFDPPTGTFGKRQLAQPVIALEDLSPALRDWLNSDSPNGRITLSYNGETITADNFPAFSMIPAGSTLQTTASCSSTEACQILGQWRNFWIRTRADRDDGTVGTTSHVFLEFVADCVGEFDQCGVCNGDNRTCQCVFYKDFQSARMAYEMAQWSTDQILSKVNCSLNALKDTQTTIRNPLWDSSTVKADVVDRIELMMNFYNFCLNDYCKEVGAFRGALEEYLHQVTNPDHPDLQ